MIDIEAVKKAISESDGEAVVKIFEGATEAERREVAKEVKKLYRDEPFLIEGDDGHTFYGNNNLQIAGIALLACATVSDLPAYIDSFETELLATVARQRPQKWIDAYVQKELTKGESCRWAILRELMRHGLCNPVEDNNFILGMINRLSQANWRANFDRWSKNDTWQDAILTLSAEGRLDRGRLLDSAVEALNRGFNKVEARWFTGLFDRLEPTDEEIAERLDKLCPLLRSSNSQTIQWSFKLLKAREKRGITLAPEKYIDALPDMFTVQSKAFVKQVLKLAQRLIADLPKRQDEIARSIADLLIRDAADIQGMAIDFLEANFSPPDQVLAETLVTYRDYVVTSVRTRFDKYLGGVAKASPTELGTTEEPSTCDLESLRAATAELKPKIAKNAGLKPMLTAAGSGKILLPPLVMEVLLDIPRCTDENLLPLIQTPEELIEGLAEWIESPDDYVRLETLMAAMGRLSGEYDEDFLKSAEPLADRAKKKLIGAFDEPVLIYASILAWIDPALLGSPKIKEVLKKHVSIPKKGNLLSMQIETIHKSHSASILSQLRTTQPFILLSEPTHHEAWVAPPVLVDRWLAMRSSDCPEPMPTDALLALLRLARDDRRRALTRLKKKAAKRPCEFESALRFALGDDSIKIGSDNAL